MLNLHKDQLYAFSSTSLLLIVLFPSFNCMLECTVNGKLLLMFTVYLYIYISRYILLKTNLSYEVANVFIFTVMQRFLCTTLVSSNYLIGVILIHRLI